MLEQYLIESNPHWQGRKFVAGTPRELLSRVVKLLEIDHIIAITGIRRCGKSYFLRQLANHLLETTVPADHILFVNFDMPAFVGEKAHLVLDEILNTFKKLKNPQGKVYILFDEIQALPKWETWVKYNYDLYKGQVKFIITGSNSQLLATELSTLLTGRVIEKRLFPFSFSEVLTHRGIDWKTLENRVLKRTEIMAHFDHYLVNGGMPELLDVELHEERREHLVSYFDAIIYRDIVPRFSVRQAGLLNELAIYLLGHTSNLVNLYKTADYYKANRKTVREFTNFLQTALFIFMTPKFSFSPKTRELSLKKCFAADNGFVSYLPLQFSPNHGILLENLVFVELQRRYLHVFYWRNNRECDFITIDHAGVRHAFQVCYRLTRDNRDREINGLVAVMSSPFNCEGMILTFSQTDEFTVDGHKIIVKPVFRWLVEIRNY